MTWCAYAPATVFQASRPPSGYTEDSKACEEAPFSLWDSSINGVGAVAGEVVL